MPCTWTVLQWIKLSEINADVYCMWVVNFNVRRETAINKKIHEREFLVLKSGKYCKYWILNISDFHDNFCKIYLYLWITILISNPNGWIMRFARFIVLNQCLWCFHIKAYYLISQCRQIDQSISVSLLSWYSYKNWQHTPRLQAATTYDGFIVYMTYIHA